MAGIMQQSLSLDEALSRIIKLEAQINIWKQHWSKDTQLDKVEMTQEQSDLYWFAKGFFEIGADWQGKPRFCEGSDIAAFWTMINTYSYKNNMVDVLSELGGTALLDTTYPSKSYADFLKYWMKLTTETKTKVDSLDIMVESMNAILVQWVPDKRFIWKTPTWNPNLGKKKKGDTND